MSNGKECANFHRYPFLKFFLSNLYYSKHIAEMRLNLTENGRHNSHTMAVIETIAPIFFIIVFGYLLQQKGLLKAQFIQEANRFVFLFSLPVLIFTGIMKSDIKDIGLINILSVIIPTLVILCLAFILAFAMGLKKGTLGSFVQTTFHGNITYIGLAVLYYMLGDEGLKKGKYTHWLSHTCQQYPCNRNSFLDFTKTE